MNLKRQDIFIIVLFVGITLSFVLLSLSELQAEEKQAPPKKSGYLGSSECRSCHEKFYQLWAPSHHGLAMQPYTPEFASKNLTDHKEAIVIGDVTYQVVMTDKEGYVVETSSKGEKKYPILHVLGGKNVYYFLTPLEKGHLQTLPAAYDVNRKRWFDTAASAVRHFPDREEEAIHWTDRQYMFNTACYGCHVSQLVKNYDPETDSYNTQWKEPGINCEACHGPADEHVRVCQEAAAKGEEPKEMKLLTITQSRGFTPHQVDAACSICHAKSAPLTNEFIPGDDFYQHYDLVTLEHPDYYADGRDLGENYTFTSWSMSPCSKVGKLDCVYCHTSSGRYRFKEKNPNGACTSCHTEKGEDFKKHTHHGPKTGVTQCIQCHMPMTEFGRMMRSDHSMRPPMPALSIKYKSPNACNLCHKDKDAEWADKKVRRWHKNDYQKEPMKIAGWVDNARKNQWDQLQLDEILTYMQSEGRDEVYTNTLIRLLRGNLDKRIAPVLISLLENDPSPLIRASAANVLLEHLDEKSLTPLLKATQDPYRLVRIRAAATLAAVPEPQVPQAYRESLAKATEEFKASLMSRPDDSSSHFNMANHYQTKGMLEQAAASFERCLNLRADFVPAYINSSMTYNALGQNDKAIASLKTAIKHDPKNAAAYLNMALLYGEMGQYADAKAAFEKTLELDPQSAVAAYNLSVLSAQEDMDQAVYWSRKAYELAPDNAKYGYTLAYYYSGQNRLDDAVDVLQPLVDAGTNDYNVYLMLADVYSRQQRTQKVIDVLKKGADNPNFDQQTRSYFQRQIQQFLSQ